MGDPVGVRIVKNGGSRRRDPKPRAQPPESHAGGPAAPRWGSRSNIIAIHFTRLLFRDQTILQILRH